MSLYHKYRPDSFAKMHGNKAALHSLAQALSKPAGQRHGYTLLTGASGCGKTTLARIIANTLGADPGDVREVNGAMNNKVEDARAIVQELSQFPVFGPMTVYFIDEAHRMTPGWWDIMLKPLEDTPAHVHFIIGTSEAHKIPKAAYNRAHHVEVQPLTPKQMFGLLDEVVSAEGLTIPDEHMEAVVAAADGSPRQALTMLEKIIPAKSMKDVVALLATSKDAEETAEVKDLCNALMGNKTFAECAKILAKLKAQDPETIRRGVIGYLSAVALSRGDKNLASIVGIWAEHTTYDSGFPMLVGLLDASTTH